MNTPTNKTTNTLQSTSSIDFELNYRAWRDRCDQVTNLEKLFVIGCAKSGTTLA